MKLFITSIKPNPSGKDRNNAGGASASQLTAERVDFRNDTGQTVNLAGLSVWHKAYSGNINIGGQVFASRQEATRHPYLNCVE